MLHITAQTLSHLLATYGYWAVLVFVAIESTGIPFPGETMLLTASIYAGTTHNLNIILVIAAAAVGAILGDNIGFWVGREGGFALLRRYGKYIRLDERRLKLGQYLFMKHGGKVVFFGRFVAVLRAWAAFLAGTSQMAWPAFLVANAAGAILWATLYGLGGYVLGTDVHRIARPFGIAALVIAGVVIIAGFVFLRRNEKRLEEEAVRALPGPLEHHHHARHPQHPQDSAPPSTRGSDEQRSPTDTGARQG
jgi:membrane protein DedA with SNARE-associated domain